MISTPLTRDMIRAGRSIAGLPDDSPERTDDVASCIACTHALVIAARLLPTGDPGQSDLADTYRTSQLALYYALRSAS